MGALPLGSPYEIIALRGDAAERIPAMAEIANEIGRLVCQPLWDIIPQCRTGEPLEDIGYGAAGLLLLFIVVIRFLGQPRTR